MKAVEVVEERQRGVVLVRIARESLAEALGLGSLAAYEEPWLQEPGATFITLRRNQELRGCVGSIRAYRPLLEDVRSNTRAAAFSDTRFSPVQPSEYPELSVEVSLLTTPEPFEVESEDDACARLRPGVDGVLFECGSHRSTFLPQVWEQLPDPRHFLAHLKIKAGLPVAFWSADVRLQRYTVLKFVEEGD